MFGSSDKKEKKVNKLNRGTLNSIVQGTVIHGDIESDSDIRIDGSLIGGLKCKGKLIIGETGNIEGDIQCQSAVIQGKFEGKLIVDEVLDVKNTGKINGEIETKKLIVEAGAVFNVRCKMGEKSFGTSPLDPFIERNTGKAKETA